eukprot:CAMPEP_0202874700 /NCGR_PEP_ID=MMETSP1391-20130828/25874_1 /ASSEMBLY_ACC=CAM_ASM_000867 /TAXON_ID=1034604 /ORGANISM="Chlamydomonas leiostraca, Strain SAG 11-49" /LENGTH=56 /DNA_ID=CAMNT_0049556203 /DNA_START=467 /DNA_END=637 /DNA_ORIENTATION=+
MIRNNCQLLPQTANKLFLTAQDVIHEAHAAEGVNLHVSPAAPAAIVQQPLGIEPRT